MLFFSTTFLCIDIALCLDSSTQHMHLGQGRQLSHWRIQHGGLLNLMPSSLTESSDLSRSIGGDSEHSAHAPAPSDGRKGNMPKSHDDAPASATGPEALTQRYLHLLNSGRLASKKKLDRDACLTRQSSKQAEGEAEKPKSVYEADIMRMRTTAAAMDVEPLQQNTSLLGGGVSSPQRCSSARGAPDGSLLACSMYQRLYKPGPADYRPMVDRRGGWEGCAVSFGTARQRPPNACVQETSVSPGPVYMPSKQMCSSLSSPPRFRFGKGSVGSRTDLHSDKPSNHSHWNPGPGQYDPCLLSNGDCIEPGVSGPLTVFGSGPKLMTPQLNLSATVFVSPIHAEKENKGVHSPGPARYSPDIKAVSTCAAQYTLGTKTAGYFDAFMDPLRQTSPGPVYHTGTGVDRKGTKTWGVGPRTTFGKAGKSWDPELNLSATTFISQLHAHHVNQGVHSPGPVYAPDVKPHVPTVYLSSGPRDRFYDRLEPGRL